MPNLLHRSPLQKRAVMPKSIDSRKGKGVERRTAPHAPTTSSIVLTATPYVQRALFDEWLARAPERPRKERPKPCVDMKDGPPLGGPAIPTMYFGFAIAVATFLIGLTTDGMGPLYGLLYGACVFVASILYGVVGIMVHEPLSKLRWNIQMDRRGWNEYDAAHAAWMEEGHSRFTYREMYDIRYSRPELFC